jgi:hypothetical protein
VAAASTGPSWRTDDDDDDADHQVYLRSNGHVKQPLEILIFSFSVWFYSGTASGCQKPWIDCFGASDGVVAYQLE